MAKILRFEEPTSFSPLNYRGLDQIPVYIAEEGGNSYDYFGFTQIPDELTAGRNLLSFTGTKNLVPGAEIAIEVMDANGDLIPVRTYDHIGFGQERVFSIEIDDKVPEGDALITVVSVAKGKVAYNKDSQRDIGREPPERYRQRFNLRWQKRLNCYPRKRNTSDLQFFPNPDITIEEVKRPYFKLHYNQKLNTIALGQASGSFTLAAPFSHSQEVRIDISDGHIYRFLAEDAPIIPDDSSPVFFFPTGSTIAEDIVNLRDQINSASIGVHCQTGSSTSELGFTASYAGPDGNNIFIYTASYSVLFETASFTIPEASMSNYHELAMTASGHPASSSFVIGQSISTAVTLSFTSSVFAQANANEPTIMYIPTASAFAGTVANLVEHFNNSSSLIIYTASLGAISASTVGGDLIFHSKAPSGSAGNSFIFVSSSLTETSTSYFTGGVGIEYGPVSQSLQVQLGGGSTTLVQGNSGSEYFLVSTGSETPTGVANTSAKLRYEVQGDKYFVYCIDQADFGGFTDDMIGGTLYFPNPQGVFPRSVDGPYSNAVYNERETGDGQGNLNSGSATAQYTSRGAYNTFIIERLSPLQVRVNSPHTSFQGIGRAQAREVFHTRFGYSDFRLDWAQNPVSRSNSLATGSDEMVTSYARIHFNNLTPLVGDVTRIKTFIRNDQMVNDYFLVGDNPVYAPELLVQTASRFDRLPAGDFSEFGCSGSYETYWTASSGDSALAGPTLTPFKTNLSTLVNPMPEALQVGDTITANKHVLDDTNYWTVDSAIPMLMQKDKHYEVSFKSFAMKHTGSNFTPNLDIYVWGGAVTDTGDDLGKLIGTIKDVEGQSELITEDDVFDQHISKGIKFSFKSDATEYGFLRFKIKHGIWWLSNISVKPFDKYGYTPHFFEAIIPTPKANVTTKDALDFKFEFYNSDHRSAAYTSEIKNVEFDNEYTFTATSVFFTSASIRTFFGDTPIGDNDWVKTYHTSAIKVVNMPELHDSIYTSGSVGIGDFSTTGTNALLHIKNRPMAGNSKILLESYSSSILHLAADVGGTADGTNKSAYILIDHNNSATSSIIGYNEEVNKDPGGATLTGATEGSFIIHERHGRIMSFGIGGTAPLHLVTGKSNTFENEGYGAVFVGWQNPVPGTYSYELDVSGSEIIRSGTLFLPNTDITTSAGIDYYLGTTTVNGRTVKVEKSSVATGDEDWFISTNYISQSRIPGTSGRTVWIGDNNDMNNTIAPNSYIFQISQSTTNPRIQLLGIPSSTVTNLLGIDGSGNVFITASAAVGGTGTGGGSDDDWHTLSSTQLTASKDIWVSGSISASGDVYARTLLIAGGGFGEIGGKVNTHQMYGSLNIGAAHGGIVNTLVNGGESIVVGSGNNQSTANGKNAVIGFMNSASGVSGLVVGYGNLISGTTTATCLLGNSNAVLDNDNDNNILLGANHAHGDGKSSTVSLGLGHKPTGSEAGYVVAGRFCEQKLMNAPFVVGGGDNDEARLNLLEVHASTHGHHLRVRNVTITQSLGVGLYPSYKLDVHGGDGDNPARIRTIQPGHGAYLKVNTATGVLYYHETSIPHDDDGGILTPFMMTKQSSPSIQIVSGTVQMVKTTAATSSLGYFTGSAIIGELMVDPNDENSFYLSSSLNQSASMYFSGSGRVGFGTTDPQADFEILTDDLKISRRNEDVGVKMNEEGNFVSFANDTAKSATGSEYILMFAGGSEAEPVKPSTGDVLGSIRWLVESGALDLRSSGEAARIRSTVVTSTDAGVASELEFMVDNSEDATAAPTTVLRLRPTGLPHEITGSLDLSGNMYHRGSTLDIAGQLRHLDDVDTLLKFESNAIKLLAGDGTNPKITINSNGVTFNENHLPSLDFRVEGDADTHLIFADAGADKVAIGTGTVGNSLLTIDGDVTTTDITASGNISSSTLTGTHEFGGTLSLRATDPRIKIKAIGGNHPGLELYEDSTRKWIMFNDPANDNLTFKNDTNDWAWIKQTGEFELSQSLIAGTDVTASANINVGQYIRHIGDPDTHINFTTDDINFHAGGQNMIDLTSGSQSEITFNEAGIDIDFRVEGDSDTKLFFTDAGNDKVGIGTNTPSKKLEVAGDISASGQLFISSDTGTLITLERDNAQNAAIVYKNSQGYMVAGIDNDAGNTGANVFGIGYHGDLIDSDGSDHATFIVTGSQVVINNATSASSEATLTVGGGIHTTTHITASGNISASGYIYAGGDIHSTGDVVASSTTPSDYRLKENIEEIENPIDILQQLVGKSFNWKKTGEFDYGLIAQEVEKILPELVKEKEILGEKGTQKVVKYVSMIPILIESIKSLENKNNSLEDKLNKLIEEVDKLKNI